MTVGVEFTATCPCGHPDAAWRTFMQEPPGSSGGDYLCEQLPTYRVECACCGGTSVVQETGSS